MTIPNRYKRVQIGTYSDGSPKFITWGLKVFLYHVEADNPKTGVPWSITQGCYHAGSLSAGTHDGADIVDTSNFEGQKRLRAIKDFGGFGWIRDGRDSSSFADPNDHMHWGIKNSRKMSLSAKSQLKSYLLGKNGLANNGDDRYDYRSDRQFHYKKAYRAMVTEKKMEHAERILATTKKNSKLHNAILRFIIRFRSQPKKDH